ncbi:hypothetical protein Tco_0790544 [Tanacetum coccineum]
MPELMRDVLYARMHMEHRDGDGVMLFTSEAWGKVFDTRGPLVRELILKFHSTLRFGEVLLDLEALGTIQFQLGGARRRLSWREFILALGLHTGEEMESLSFTRYWSESERMIPGKGDLRDYWREISTNGDFLGPRPSYNLISDPMLRIYHRMMAHGIAGRSQALEKSGALISGGQFVAQLAEHFGLLTEERLQGLTAWVPSGLARKKGDAGGVAEEASVAPGCGVEDEEMPQGQREVLDSMARDLSRFTTWTITSLSRLMDSAGVPYTRYSESPIKYQSRTRQRTDGASVSTALQQPDL